MLYIDERPLALLDGISVKLPLWVTDTDLVGVPSHGRSSSVLKGPNVSPGGAGTIGRGPLGKTGRSLRTPETRRILPTSVSISS